MTVSWQEFLAALGARFAEGQLLDFGQLEAEQEAAILMQIGFSSAMQFLTISIIK